MKRLTFALSIIVAVMMLTASTCGGGSSSSNGSTDNGQGGQDSLTIIEPADSGNNAMVSDTMAPDMIQVDGTIPQPVKPIHR